MKVDYFGKAFRPGKTYYAVELPTDLPQGWAYGGEDPRSFRIVGDTSSGGLVMADINDNIQSVIYADYLTSLIREEDIHLYEGGVNKVEATYAPWPEGSMVYIKTGRGDFDSTRAGKIIKASKKIRSGGATYDYQVMFTNGSIDVIPHTLIIPTHMYTPTYKTVKLAKDIFWYKKGEDFTLINNRAVAPDNNLSVIINAEICKELFR